MKIFESRDIFMIDVKSMDKNLVIFILFPGKKVQTSREKVIELAKYTMVDDELINELNILGSTNISYRRNGLDE